MREISTNLVTNAVERLCIRAASDLPFNVEELIQKSIQTEESPLAKEILGKILENAEYARNNNLPICQDTGIACLFVEIGQELTITGGVLSEAINEGVRRGYKKAYLRKSVAKDPLFDRSNTEDNTPAIISYTSVPGDRMHIKLLPKGGGSENCGAVKMLRPADGVDGVKEFVLQSVIEAGGKPCPPIVVGIGIGATLNHSALLAKRALCRPLGSHNNNSNYAKLEQEILDEINRTGIGPQGLGGRTTALAVQIEYRPTHIACLPVAVDINCHANRYKEVTI